MSLGSVTLAGTTANQWQQPTTIAIPDTGQVEINLRQTTAPNSASTPTGASYANTAIIEVAALRALTAGSSGSAVLDTQSIQLLGGRNGTSHWLKVGRDSSNNFLFAEQDVSAEKAIIELYTGKTQAENVVEVRPAGNFARPTDARNTPTGTINDLVIQCPSTQGVAQTANPNWSAWFTLMDSAAASGSTALNATAHIYGKQSGTTPPSGGIRTFFQAKFVKVNAAGTTETDIGESVEAYMRNFDVGSMESGLTMATQIDLAMNEKLRVKVRARCQNNLGNNITQPTTSLSPPTGRPWANPPNPQDLTGLRVSFGQNDNILQLRELTALLDVSDSSVPDASLSVKGKVELATDAEVAAGTDNLRAVTPAGLLHRTSSTSRSGLVQLATLPELRSGTDNTKAVTPHALGSLIANETQKGLIEIATETEALDTASPENDKAITPATLKARFDAFAGTGGAVPDATTSQKGKVELATDAETQESTSPSATLVVTPHGLDSRTATETRTGLIELATVAETQGQATTDKAVTPAGLAARISTESRAGLLEIADSSEITGGVATDKAVTPAGLQSKLDALINSDVAVVEFDPDATVNINTPLTHADGAQAFDSVPRWSNTHNDDGTIIAPAVSDGDDWNTLMETDATTAARRYNATANVHVQQGGTRAPSGGHRIFAQAKFVKVNTAGDTETDVSVPSDMYCRNMDQGSEKVSIEMSTMVDLATGEKLRVKVRARHQSALTTVTATGAMVAQFDSSLNNLKVRIPGGVNDGLLTDITEDKFSIRPTNDSTIVFASSDPPGPKFLEIKSFLAPMESDPDPGQGSIGDDDYRAPSPGTPGVISTDVSQQTNGLRIDKAGFYSLDLQLSIEINATAEGEWGISLLRTNGQLDPNEVVIGSWLFSQHINALSSANSRYVQNITSPVTKLDRNDFIYVAISHVRAPDAVSTMTFDVSPFPLESFLIIREYNSGAVVDTIPDSTATVKGKVALASNSETQGGTNTVKAVTPAGLASRTASTTRTGLVQLARDADALTATSLNTVLTPSNIDNIDFTKLHGTPTGWGSSGQILESTGSAAQWVAKPAAGTSTFAGLTDTPNALTGQGGKYLAINSGATAVEFVDAPTGGLDQAAVDARVTAGVLNPAEVGNTDAWPAAKIPNLPASKINSGTLDVARIPDLSGPKITSGTVPSARLPSASETAAGIIELASNAETATASATNRALTPSNIGHIDFTDIAGTPGTWGTTGQMLAMNSNANALEFVDAPSGGGLTAVQVRALIADPAEQGNTDKWPASKIANLPSSQITGTFGNASISELAASKLTGLSSIGFTDLGDTPNNYGNATNILRSNATTTGVEWFEYDFKEHLGNTITVSGGNRYVDTSIAVPSGTVELEFLITRSGNTVQRLVKSSTILAIQSRGAVGDIAGQNDSPVVIGTINRQSVRVSQDSSSNFIIAIEGSQSATVDIYQLPTSDITSLLSLDDTPGTFDQQANNILQVNATSNAIEFVENSFTGLTGTPGSWGTTGQILKMNAAANGLVFANDDSLNQTAVDARITGKVEAAALQGNAATWPETKIGDLSADKIASGSFDDDRIPSLNASKIANGEFSLDRIPTLTAAKVPSLNASKITAGTFPSTRLPTASNTEAETATSTTKLLTPGNISSIKFVSLAGTPSSYSNGMILESTASGTQWVAKPTSGLSQAQVDNRIKNFAQDGTSSVAARTSIATLMNSGTSTAEKLSFNNLKDKPAQTFLALTDAPNAFTGQAGKFLKVNTGATALEFTDAPSGGSSSYIAPTAQQSFDAIKDRLIAGTNVTLAKNDATDQITFNVASTTTFAALTDTPASFASNAGKVLEVNNTANGIKFADAVPRAFKALNDTPTSFSGQAGKLLKVNIAEDAIEFVNPPSQQLLTGSVTILGETVSSKTISRTAVRTASKIMLQPRNMAAASLNTFITIIDQTSFTIHFVDKDGNTAMTTTAATVFDYVIFT